MNTSRIRSTLYVIVGAIVVIGAIGALASLGQGETTKTSSTEPQASTAAQERSQDTSTQPKSWQPVTTLSGENAKRGEIFEITGTQQRITYTVNGDYPALYVYLMKEGTSLDRDGGMSQVTGATGQGDTLVYSLPGRYYLDVNGVGSWTVTLEELR